MLGRIGQKKGNLELKEALHFTKIDSVIDGKQSDHQFLYDVKQISQKKQSTIKNFSLLSSQEQVISSEQCQQIHDIALLHKQANLFNLTSMLQASQIKPQEYCQCGCQRGKGQPFPLCMDEQKLAFLGPGVLLIFFYLKQVRWTLLLVFLTYGVFSLFTNILMADSDYCWELCTAYSGLDLYFCYLTEISSFKRKIGNEYLVQFQVWIGFIMCVIWIFSIKFIKHLGDSKNEEIDEMLDSASDYTVRVDNLPSRKYNEYDLIDYVKELWNTRQTINAQNLSDESASHFCHNEPHEGTTNNNQQLRLRSVQLIYNMESCRNIINDVLNLSYEIAKCFEDFDDGQGGDGNKNQGRNSQGGRKSTKKSSIKVEDPTKLTNKISSSFSSSNNSNFRSSSILENIRFRKNSEKNVTPSPECKIKDGLESKYLQLKKKLISRYTELNDLRKNFLQNSEYRKQLSTTCALLQFESNDQQKQFLSYFSTDLHKNSIERLFCQSKNLTFKDTQIQINRAAQPSDMIWLNCEKQFSLLRYFIILMGAFMVLACSYTLIHFLRTSSLFKGSNVYLNSIMVQCFNRIIWISLSNLVVLQYNNTKTDSIISLMKLSITAQVINVIVSPLIFNFFVNDNKIYGFGGMSGNVVIYQFIMFIMMTFFYVLNPFYYIKKIILMFQSTRNIMIRNLCQVVGQVDTIDEIRPVLNYYEGPDFPIAGGYVYMTTAIFHTLFYCHLQPIVIVFAIVNISGFLVIMKYILFRRCRIPELTEIQIFDFAMFGLSCGAASYGAGSLYFLVISQYALGLDIQISKYIPSCLCIIFWFISSMNPFGMFTKFNDWVIKYLGFDQKPIEQEQETKSRIGNRRPELVEAGNILLKIFEQEMVNKKAKRKQSYYQYSNVKKLLNYECQLKEVIIGQEQKNNIIFFCESFCDSQKEEEFKKKSINARQQKPISHPVGGNKQQENPSRIIKRRNPSKTIPQRVIPNKKLDPLIVQSDKNKKLITKHSQERNSYATRNAYHKETVHQELQEDDQSSDKGTNSNNYKDGARKNTEQGQSDFIPVIKL